MQTIYQIKADQSIQRHTGLGLATTFTDEQLAKLMSGETVVRFGVTYSLVPA